MLEALVHAAERFREEGNLPPIGYKPKIPKWIITLKDKKAYLEGPYTPKEISKIYAPDRQRSGTKPEPFLLLDKAQYVFGIPKNDKKAAQLHKKYMTLLEEAAKEAQEPSLYCIIEFLRGPQLEGLEKIKPGDLVAIRIKPDRFPFELESVQKFWSEYLSRELRTDYQAICSICGAETNILRILPREIVVLGQKCQISSFNKSAFLSFGRTQTTNAPICFDCASKAIDALDYLIRTERHHKLIWRNPKALSGLDNQLAVFWLDKKTEVSFEERTYDIEELLSLVLEGTSDSAPTSATLSQLRQFLDIPWTAKEAALLLDERRFYLAVLSANKGRLVVREWLEARLGAIRTNLRKFLQSTCIISPWGDEPRPLPIRTLVGACEGVSPNLIRGLMRTAYIGYDPPWELLEAALRRLRIPSVVQDRQNTWRLHALAAAIKLKLFYGKEEVRTMEQLDPERKNQAYLCGRLLAVLEEAQLRASDFKLKRTIVDRFYGAASTAPAFVFGGLIKLATTAHLPKVSPEVQGLVEEILSILDEAGGFPRTLTQREQAEFALGFYHQRAYFRAQRGKGKAESGEPTPEQKTTEEGR
jgi:CRISPR-associated protein Csd1